MFALRKYPMADNNYQIMPCETRLDELDLIKLDRKRINTTVMFYYVMNDNNFFHC